MVYETRCVCCDSIFKQAKRHVKESGQVCPVCERSINTIRADFYYLDNPEYTPRYYILREFDTNNE